MIFGATQRIFLTANHAKIQIKPESENQTSQEIATTIFNEIRGWFAAFINCISCKRENRSE